MKTVEILHPSEFVRDELKARGWDLYKFAKKINRCVTEAANIAKGYKDIDEQTAEKLAKAFGISKEFWINSQNQYNEKAKENQWEK